MWKQNFTYLVIWFFGCVRVSSNLQKFHGGNCWLFFTLFTCNALSMGFILLFLYVEALQQIWIQQSWKGLPHRCCIYYELYSPFINTSVIINASFAKTPHCLNDPWSSSSSLPQPGIEPATFCSAAWTPPSPFPKKRITNAPGWI